MKKLNIYFSLPSDERAALRQSWILILLSKIVLPFFQLPRLTAAIDRWIPPAKDRRPIPPERLAELVAIAGRRTLGSTCLHRSLALLVLLRRQATMARLAIGVRRTDEFAAHAWVETMASETAASGVEPHYTRLLEYEI